MLLFISKAPKVVTSGEYATAGSLWIPVGFMHCAAVSIILLL